MNSIIMFIFEHYQCSNLDAISKHVHKPVLLEMDLLLEDTKTGIWPQQFTKTFTHKIFFIIIIFLCLLRYGRNVSMLNMISESCLLESVWFSCKAE